MTSGPPPEPPPSSPIGTAATAVACPVGASVAAEVRGPAGLDPSVVECDAVAVTVRVTVGAGAVTVTVAAAVEMTCGAADRVTVAVTVRVTLPDVGTVLVDAPADVDEPPDDVLVDEGVLVAPPHADDGAVASSIVIPTSETPASPSAACALDLRSWSLAGRPEANTSAYAAAS